MRAWTSPKLFRASTLCLSEASGSLPPSIGLFSFSKRASTQCICVFIDCRTESEFIEGLTQDLRATHVLRTRWSFTTGTELRPNLPCNGFSADSAANAEFDRASDSEHRVISSAISEGEDRGNELEDCRDLTGPTRGQEREGHSRGMLAWGGAGERTRGLPGFERADTGTRA